MFLKLFIVINIVYICLIYWYVVVALVTFANDFHVLLSDLIYVHVQTNKLRVISNH